MEGQQKIKFINEILGNFKISRLRAAGKQQHEAKYTLCRTMYILRLTI